MGQPFIILVCHFLQLLLLTQSGNSQCSNSNPCIHFQVGEPMQKCEYLTSNDGVLNITLYVDVAEYKFDWLLYKRRAFNGITCPPTWRIKRGDHVNVLLVNNLTANPAREHVQNTYGLPNTTNLHVHGLHISQLSPQDNVFVRIEPGESYQYRYIIEDDHPSGTFWYHTHVHGSGALQLSDGLAGVIIIEDDPDSSPDELTSVSCPNNCQHDVSFLFNALLQRNRDIQIASEDNLRLNNTDIGDGKTLENWIRENVNYVTTNGQLKPSLEIEAGQMKRFRLINAGISYALELELVAQNGNSSCKIREIARDGVYFNSPMRLKLDQILLGLGNRADWLVQCGVVGIYELRSTARTINDISVARPVRYSDVLATINVTKSNILQPSNASFPVELPQRPEYDGDLRNTTANATIIIEMNDGDRLNRDQWNGSTDFRYKLEVDSIVDVQFINAERDFSHSMHIHGHHFQVISYNPYIGPYGLDAFPDPVWDLRRQDDNELCFYQYRDYAGKIPQANDPNPLKYIGHDERWRAGGADTLAYAEAGEWRDTIFVPSLANITVRMKLAKFTGPLLIHCHFPRHSDSGMMMVVDVVEKGGDLSAARIDSGGAFPGSCKRCDWNLFKDIPNDCDQVTTVTAFTTLTTADITSSVITSGLRSTFTAFTTLTTTDVTSSVITSGLQSTFTAFTTLTTTDVTSSVITAGLQSTSIHETTKIQPTTMSAAVTDHIKSTRRIILLTTIFALWGLH